MHIKDVIQEIELEQAVGKKVKRVLLHSHRLEVELEDGTLLEAYEGDSGTMRDPEPYFTARITTPKRKS